MSTLIDNPSVIPFWYFYVTEQLCCNARSFMSPWLYRCQHTLARIIQHKATASSVVCVVMSTEYVLRYMERAYDLDHSSTNCDGVAPVRDEASQIYLEIQIFLGPENVPA